MWLTLTSIVLAAAIGFNVLALWLTGWFERKQPESRNRTADLHPRIGQEGNGYQRSADRVQGVVRTKVEEYRQYAQESLQLAGMTTSPEHRAVLVMMAQAWKLLAQFHCLAASPKYRHNQTLMPTHKVASM